MIKTRVIYSLLASNFSTIALQLLLVPTLIKSWGVEKYGLWILVSTIPSIVAMLDFGILTASANRVHIAAARGQAKRASTEFVSSGIGLLTLCVFALALVAAVVAVGVSKLYHGVSAGEETIWGIVLFMLCVDGSASLLLNHVASLFRLRDKYHYTVNFGTASRMLPAALLLVMAVSGCGPAESSILMALSRAMILSYAISVAYRQLGSSWFQPRRFRAKYLLKALGDGMVFTSFPVGNGLALHATTMLVASYFGPAIVAAYSASRTLTRMLPQFISLVARSNWAAIAAEFAEKDGASIERYSNLGMRAAYLSAAVLGLVLAIAGKLIIALWVGDSLWLGSATFLALLFSGCLTGLYTAAEVPLLATNSFTQYAQAFILAMIASVIVAWSTVAHFGLIAVPLSQCVAALFILLISRRINSSLIARLRSNAD